MKDFQVELNTDGSGLWSNVAKEVSVNTLDLAYISFDENFGDLHVSFDADDWDIDVFGLIYTDKLFLKELKAALAAAGFNADNIDYSEMGMQGRDFVSLDVGAGFIESWFSK
jgi:hypothetical protein